MKKIIVIVFLALISSSIAFGYTFQDSVVDSVRYCISTQDYRVSYEYPTRYDNISVVVVKLDQDIYISKRYDINMMTSSQYQIMGLEATVKYVLPYFVFVPAPVVKDVKKK